MRFFCGRGLAGGRKSPLTASLTLAVKFVSLFFNNNWINSDLTSICKVTHGHDCYLKRITLTDETRLADPHTLLLKE